MKEMEFIGDFRFFSSGWKTESKSRRRRRRRRRRGRAAKLSGLDGEFCLGGQHQARGQQAQKLLWVIGPSSNSGLSRVGLASERLLLHVPWMYREETDEWYCTSQAHACTESNLREVFTARE